MYAAGHRSRSYAAALALARTPSGGYIFELTAGPQATSQPEIAVFDGGMHLCSGSDRELHAAGVR